MKEYRVGFDVDGIFADFHYMASIASKGKIVRTSTFMEDWVGSFYRGIKLEPDFWKRMPRIIENTLEGIKPVCFITTIEPAMLDYRKEWLVNTLGIDANVPVYAASNKVGIIDDMELDFFVDDNPDLIRDVLDAEIGCTPIQMLPYYADYEVVCPELLVRSVAEFKNRFLI